ncbi:MAG: DMT family transporter [Gammaproteobacteria bacterium]|nr:DMT family transporter [Gammaproteobacteria bacterium]NIR81678.1 DMT family transporter [Gammaproteobacteria bacterium]NIR88241.1 DMT family transporter [Gammaproteobacteria bacterium]NIU02780.1 DMT family transporter [Gammaproteobacteria bacterium]NIV50304.1 EamA family transporter [Gammaproteobacteria bacterium]
MATVGVIVLSPDGLILRIIEADRWTVVFWRGLLMALALAVFLALRYRRSTPQQVRAVGRRGLLSGALFAASTVFFVSSITLTTVANTLVIVSAAPLFGAVMSYLFLREMLALRTWLAILAAVLGILVIFYGSVGGGALLGDLCAVGTAFCMAANLVVIRHARAVNMLPAVVLSGVLGALAVLPLATPFRVSAQDASLLLLLGLIILPVSLGLITLAPRYIPAPEVSLIMLLEAILGPLLVWMALGETPGVETFIGGGLVLGTLAVHFGLRLRETRRVA